jgi:hypothetical protein
MLLVGRSNSLQYGANASEIIKRRNEDVGMKREDEKRENVKRENVKRENVKT